jgi:hypothetical protein
LGIASTDAKDSSKQDKNPTAIHEQHRLPSYLAKHQCLSLPNQQYKMNPKLDSNANQIHKNDSEPLELSCAPYLCTNSVC